MGSPSDIAIVYIRCTAHAGAGHKICAMGTLSAEKLARKAARFDRFLAGWVLAIGGDSSTPGEAMPGLKDLVAPGMRSGMRARIASHVTAISRLTVHSVRDSDRLVWLGKRDQLSRSRLILDSDARLKDFQPCIAVSILAMLPHSKVAAPILFYTNSTSYIIAPRSSIRSTRFRPFGTM